MWLNHPVLLFPLILTIHIAIGDVDLTARVYDLEECLSSRRNYTGKLDKALDGSQCLPWAAQKHYYEKYWTKERAVQEKSYCRNPDNDVRGPWCFVEKRNYKYCNIPRCREWAADVTIPLEFCTDGQR